MDNTLTVTFTMRQALAVITALVELGLSRHSRPELLEAEMAITGAIALAHKWPQDAQQATRGRDNDYQADGCL